MSKHHRNPKRPAARRQGKPTTTEAAIRLYDQREAELLEAERGR